ncbi:CbiX/SirB N-terminal domain-containing protein [Croceibacterium xixiisoli]|uniref:(2Fe-2S) ferredoxin domain-containing protein n=1 Tax=Croceibacterium xixiisoli TaxID=1476466 RepID=UPI001928547A|nr:(2Fe-2S) ferredoxin domain-containing protein [Croceibacterium xixiisoli]
MEALAALLAMRGGLASVRIAFSEQGKPALREELLRTIDEGATSIVILPVMLPVEPSHHAWLMKAISRWEREDGRIWPDIRIAPLLSELPAMAALLGSALDRAMGDAPMGRVAEKPREGSIVPAQQRRVLVCHGGPCTAAGAALVCLGPCNLAPVVQVCPENTYYGGVDEAAVDAIIRDHILQGMVARDYAYPADGRKQVLRKS